MSLLGPILIVEDDKDDQFITLEALRELGVKNQVLFFENGPQVIQYFSSTTEQAFLILCDVNLPLMNGIELRDYIDNSPELKKKAIPFVYFTTSGSAVMVNEAYKGSIQGYFQKPQNYDDLKSRLSSIIEYWKSCLHPNTFR